MTWSLKALHLEDIEAVEIAADGVTIGRDPSNSLVLDSEKFPGVSAHHAKVVLRAGALVLEDLNSKNGTFVGGTQVDRRELNHGDTFELGVGGPRFVVLSSQGIGDTTAIHQASELNAQASERRSLGVDTVQLMREKLGISGEGGVDQMIRRRSRRHVWLAGILCVVLVVAGIVGFLILDTQDDRTIESFRAATDELARRLDDELRLARAEVAEQRRAWEDQGQRLDDARSLWESDKTALENQRSRLQESIRQLQEDEKTTAGEMARLRDQLDSTSDALNLYNPVNLELAKLNEVSRVERSVVMVEALQTFVEENSQRPLYFDQDESGEPMPNFHGQGQLFSNEGSGSGFCVNQDGWIITNAHVVFKKGSEDTIRFGASITLRPEVELFVVFSGQDARHPAELVDWAGDEQDDLALLKIEPFEDMPQLDGIDLDLEVPQRGSEVFLLGFPLGKHAMQQGDTVIASTFRGIVSRVLDSYLQVDAAVHPGASGGPLIDGQGRVVGVVVGMQAVDRNAGSSAIGYIIPIGNARKIWPPAKP